MSELRTDRLGMAKEIDALRQVNADLLAALERIKRMGLVGSSPAVLDVVDAAIARAKENTE